MTVYDLIRELSQHPADAKVHLSIVTEDGKSKKTVKGFEIEEIRTIEWHGKDVEVVGK